MAVPLSSPLNTNLAWKDLALDKETIEQIDALKLSLRHPSAVSRDGSSTKKNPVSQRILFEGKAGSLKTNAAALIGKELNKTVYRVDLSTIVSKYIGETEKNLNTLFESAEKNGWILYFDEADALFGKRTDVKDSNDRYANQEVSYLLKRIEAYQGLVILASNRKENIDDAFIRRLSAVVHFPSRKPGVLGT